MGSLRTAAHRTHTSYAHKKAFES